MVHLITPHYQRRRFFRPRRPLNIWGAVRRYQLVELLALTGAIALVWFGAHVDNQRNPWAVQEPTGIESASVELIIVPPAESQTRRRPL